MRIIRPVSVTQAGSFSRAGVGTYWDKNGVLQTAPADALRITYDPSDLTKAPFAMVEPAATNLIPQSANFNTASWSSNGATYTPNYGPAPDGERTTLVLNDGTRYCAVVTEMGKTYTYSQYVRQQSAQAVLLFREGQGASMTATFSFATEGFSNITSGCSAGFKKLGDGLYRLWLTFQSPATICNMHLYPFGGSAEFWGVQMIEGIQPGSYIPTAGAPVTRPADIISANGLIYSNVPENDHALWTATKQYVAGDRVLDIAKHKIYQAVKGLSSPATITIASPAVISMKDSAGEAYVPAVNTPVRFSTTGTLPTGLVVGTTYYVQSTTATTFTVASTVGGAAIATSGTQTGTHTATASSNINQPLTNVTHWLDAGASNRWRMFDQSVTSQTTSPDNVTIVFSPGTRVDSIVGLNLSAGRGTISVTDTVSGNAVYSAKLNLTSSSGIRDWYSYLYEPIVRLPEFVVTDLPVGVSAKSLITVTLSGTNVAAGGLVFGLSKDIGDTTWGAKVGTVDYSVKTKDNFGNYTITPRAFSKRGDFTVQVPTNTVDYLQNLLAQYRATPVVYIGSNSGDRTQFNSTVIYGFYKDFSIDIAYDAFSVCSLTVEGLT